ncbi:hypothetical protein BV22DRAFT_162467 [Leucogyrophana mollusca]|uniref:Uncharacterized protein n=1 Tax=Leucogyrophana mollusca TaxID=85980 RepID=A0ACB8BTL6_9AGAM|nr:hypothetical protein BV22DRAFT_162467 [Leucogyrophana mollusca]
MDRRLLSFPVGPEHATTAKAVSNRHKCVLRACDVCQCFAKELGRRRLNRAQLCTRRLPVTPARHMTGLEYHDTICSICSDMLTTRLTPRYFGRGRHPNIPSPNPGIHPNAPRSTRYHMSDDHPTVPRGSLADDEVDCQYHR